MGERIEGGTPAGWARIGTVVDGVWRPRPGRHFNTRMKSWGFAAAKALGHRDLTYAPSVMYIEFSNVASPGDLVSTPTPGRGDGLSYYDDLGSDPRKDVLRVPLVNTPLIEVLSGDEAYFSDGEGNVLVFYAETLGDEGLNGKPFGSAHNSTIYGIGLAAAPSPTDRSRDVLYARAYYETTDDQVPAPSVGAVGVTYSMPFG